MSSSFVYRMARKMEIRERKRGEKRRATRGIYIDGEETREWDWDWEKKLNKKVLNNSIGLVKIYNTVEYTSIGFRICVWRTDRQEIEHIYEETSESWKLRQKRAERGLFLKRHTYTYDADKSGAEEEVLNFWVNFMWRIYTRQCGR